MRALVLTSLLLVSGCGMSMAGDAADVEAAVAKVEALVVAHASAPEATVVSSCSGEMTHYRGALDAPFGMMGQRCPGMDGCMQRMGHAGADFADAWRALAAEADAHAAGGCAASDLSIELERHRAAMAGMCQHLRERAQAYGGMEGAGMHCR